MSSTRTADITWSKRMPASWRNTAVLAIAILLAFLALSAVGATVTFWRTYDQRVYPGVADAQGVQLGAITQQEGLAALAERYRPYLERELRLRYGDKEWLVRAEDLGARLDVDRVMDAAFRLGREGSLPRQLADQLTALRFGQVVDEPVLRIDERQTAARVATIRQEIDRPSVDARLVVAPELEVSVTPSQVGRELDSPRATQLLVQALTARADVMDLPVTETPPAVAERDLESVRTVLGTMLSAPVTAQFEGRAWTLSRRDIADILFREGAETGTLRELPKLDEDGLAKFTAKLAAEINQEPLRPRLRFEPGRWRVIREGRPGYALDEAAAVESIKAAIMTDDRTVQLPVQVTMPAGMSDDRGAIKELVSSATTSYAGGLAERRFNVELAAAKLNGIVVGPGEIFSFNEELGPMTAQAGFQWGWGITQSQGQVVTVPSVAGGICQVSTTLFQAIFWAGYQIEQRNWHLYWIDRYGQPPTGLKGLDATVDQVYDRNGKLVYAVDLKFKNTTTYPILIEAKTDGSRLTFNLYSTKPGWKVTVDPPEIEDVVKADPTTVEELDRSMKPGEQVWIEAAQDGFRSTIVRTVTEPGKAPRVLRLVSTYKPSRNVVRVGPPREAAPELPLQPSPTPNPVAPGTQPGRNGTPRPTPTTGA